MRLCVFCGTNLNSSHKLRKYCIECKQKALQLNSTRYRVNHVKKCLKCNTIISYNAEKCKSCNTKTRIKKKEIGFRKSHPDFRTKEGLKTMGEKISKLKRGKPNIQIRGERHFNWRGNAVGYRALHSWIERQLGKATICMRNNLHKSTSYHWANISHFYKRDLSDWIQLCPSCHRRYDYENGWKKAIEKYPSIKKNKEGAAKIII